MLTTTAEYALRIMVVLADSRGTPTTSAKIAAGASAPADYSVKVLQKLTKRGLVRAQRGRGGGFMLACDPAATTLLDVILAVEKKLHADTCAGEDDPRDTSLGELRRHLSEISALVERRLAGITLEDLGAGAKAPPPCELVTIPKALDVPRRPVAKESAAPR